jgi:hypothetical protein
VALNPSGPGRVVSIHLGRWARVLSGVMDGVLEPDHCIFKEIISGYLVHIELTRVGLQVIKHPV